MGNVATKLFLAELKMVGFGWFEVCGNARISEGDKPGIVHFDEVLSIVQVDTHNPNSDGEIHKINEEDALRITRTSLENFWVKGSWVDDVFVVRDLSDPWD